jgi:hypothetical protein
MPGFAGGGGDAGTVLLVSWWPGSSAFRFALFCFACSLTCLLCLLLAA